ncbi:MAG: membrane protein insertion efficiency factor YidD [Candidatus Levybacteria bacterium]|nr:membrane protein insertion efficiency factor YidD [Candidatus Levybacteria bacterium]MSU26136.1 membrane protein insertion efficiency factor YidD [Candidatus Levybacteria bacterium]
MKYTILLPLYFYRLFISPLMKSFLGAPNACRYSPSCSQYAIIVVRKHGFIKGLFIATMRLVSCQPWFSAKYNV